MKTAILTDSNSGISREEAERLGVYMMPMPVIINDKVYFEGRDITEQEFYNALCSDASVTTSMPSPGDLLDMWNGILKTHDELVYIPMSSGLSNSCQAAKGLALDYDGKVFVADNHRISITMHESVLTAAQLANAGLSGAEIKGFLESDAYNSTIYIAVNTLEFLKRGGRVTPAGAALATVLNIKPILTIQGEKLDSFAKARSMKKAMERMVQALLDDKANRFPEVPMERISVGGAGTMLDSDEIAAWTKLLSDAFPGAKTYYDPLSLSIGCHIGPKAFGCGLTVIPE